eukprot:scaffold25061_cov54-Attheya_sp.AAC.2
MALRRTISPRLRARTSRETRSVLERIVLHVQYLLAYCSALDIESLAMLVVRAAATIQTTRHLRFLLPRGRTRIVAPLLWNNSETAALLQRRTFRTKDSSCETPQTDAAELQPGAKAFADLEIFALADLYYHFAGSKENGGHDEAGPYLCPQGVKQLLQSIGEHPDEVTLHDLFETADLNLNGDGKLHIERRHSQRMEAKPFSVLKCLKCPLRVNPWTY